MRMLRILHTRITMLASNILKYFLVFHYKKKGNDFRTQIRETTGVDQRHGNELDNDTPWGKTKEIHRTKLG